jgi:hypothetical protein
MQTFLRRVLASSLRQFFNVTTPLLILLFVVHFGAKLNVEASPVLPPSESGSPSKFSIVTTPRELRAFFLKALSASGTTVVVGMPAADSDSFRGSYAAISESQDIDAQLVDELALVEDEVNKLPTVKPAKSLTLIAPTPDAVYNRLMELGANSRSAFPGAYAVKLKQLTKNIVLKPVAFIPSEGLTMKTTTSLVCPYSTLSIRYLEYLDFYYSKAVTTALSDFKKSDADYGRLSKHLSTLRAENRSILAARGNYASSYLSREINSLEQQVGDDGILAHSWIVTSDPFLQQGIMDYGLRRSLDEVSRQTADASQ